MEKDRLEKWRFSWRDPATGRTRRRTFPSESERDAFAATMRQVLDRERQLKKQARQRSARISAQSLTVREIIQLYLELQITRPGTKKATAYHCRPLLAMFGTRKARMMTMQDVLAFREAQALRQVGLSTVRLRLGILRSALRWAVTTGRLAANPLDGMKLPRVRSRRASPPTAAEGRKMMEVAAPHIRRIIAIGMYWVRVSGQASCSVCAGLTWIWTRPSSTCRRLPRPMALTDVSFPCVAIWWRSCAAGRMRTAPSAVPGSSTTTASR